MRPLFLLSSFYFLCFPPPSLAGWGGGSCAPVGAPVFGVPAVIEQGYRWEVARTDPDCWILRLNGVQVGAWRQSTNEYRPLINGSWGERCTAPIELPARPPEPPAPAAKKKADCPCCGETCNCTVAPCGKPGCKCVLAGATVESDGTLNFGLSRSEIGHASKRVHNGREVSKQQLMDVLQKASVPNDAGELCLTVIGPDVARQRVLADLNSSPVLSAWKGRLKVQDYAPDHWAVRDAGFVTSPLARAPKTLWDWMVSSSKTTPAPGYPIIYCQSPDGKVLHRQDGYRGAEALAEVLRKADSSYNPALDPDLNNSFTVSGSLSQVGAALESVPGWVWIALAVVLMLRFRNKR